MDAPKRPQVSFVAALVLCGLVNACESDSTRRSSPHTSADSSQSLIPSPSDVVLANLESAPRLSLGVGVRIGNSAAGPYPFVRIQSIDVSPSGDIFVLDGGNAEIIVFDSAGNLTNKFGRHGEGPGELQFDLVAALAVSRDTLFVLDGNRLHALTHDGELYYTTAVEPQRDYFSQVRAFVATSNGLVVGRNVKQPRRPTESAPITDTIAIFMRAKSNEQLVDSGLRLPGNVWYKRGLLHEFNPLFGGKPAFAVAPDGSIWYSEGNEYSIRKITLQGDSTIRFLGLVKRERITDAAKKAAIGKAANAFESSPLPNQKEVKKQYLKHYKTVPTSDFRPIIGRVFAGDGEIVAERLDLGPLLVGSEPMLQRSVGTWDVFTQSGVVIGRLRTPVGFHPRIFKNRWLIGVEFDSMGVQTLLRYAIESK